MEHIANYINAIFNTAEEVYAYHYYINTHFVAPDLLPVPEETRIQTLDVNTVRNFVLHQKCTAVGPDDYLSGYGKNLHTILHL